MKIKDVLALMPLIGLCIVFGLVVWLLMSPPAGSTDARGDNLLALFSSHNLKVMSCAVVSPSALLAGKLVYTAHEQYPGRKW